MYKDINWPEIDRKNVLENIKLAVQINGKTRDIVTVKKNLTEQEVNIYINKNSKAKKYLEENKIKKIIFVKNKIINYIVPK